MKYSFTLFLYISFCFNLFGDGKIISPLKRMPSIPDQQAVLLWDEKSKMETLAIETRFETQANNTDYCWLIPTPNKPIISSAPKGLMKEQANALYAQKDRSNIDSFLFSFSVIVLLLMIYAVSRTPENVTRVQRIRDAIIIGMILFFLAAMILPALGTARGRAKNSAGVIIHDQVSIDGVEITTLQARDIDNLMNWFKHNNYQIPASMKDSLDQHLKEHWFINACRLEDVTAEKVNPKCLQFTFATEKPIYPMRLTGVDADQPLKLRLFILGPGNAKVKNMRLVGASPVKHQELGPALRKFIPKNYHASALEGTISIEDMQEDMMIHFEAPSQKYLVVSNPNKTGQIFLLTLIWTAILLIPGYKKPQYLKRLALPLILLIGFIPYHFGSDHYITRPNFNRYHHRDAKISLYTFSQNLEEKKVRDLDHAHEIIAQTIVDEETQSYGIAYMKSYELSQINPKQIRLIIRFGMLGHRKILQQDIELYQTPETQISSP